ncbi:hypothetical protein [Streptomyces antimycoticus]|uniref:hypothetical protein n=1 Tax=Streptomyces antimycoticus TaxID=68175 RepID=UPI0038630F6C|nr:hypothetical protein OG751_11885 [Streptomyces antimycoticus]
MEREAVDGVPVRVVIAVGDGLDQADRLVEGSDVTCLLSIADQICRMFQRVAPRVVSRLLGEPGPQLTRHPPVIDQVKQTEYTDRRLKVPGGDGAALLRQGPGPIERGNGVKDIGISFFGSPTHRREEFRRHSQGIVFEYAPRISAVAELPYTSGQLAKTRILHESPRPLECPS